MKEFLDRVKNENTQVQEFVVSVLEFCECYNITFRAEDADMLVGSYAGFFCGETKELAVAVGKPVVDWLPVLVHEFSHAQQYIDTPELFLELDAGTEEFFAWSESARQPVIDVQCALMKCLFVESECEQRTVKNIKKYALQGIIDPVEYAKKANAYVTFYKYVAETREWNEYGKAPYELEEVWKLFPDKVKLFGLPLTEEIRSAFKKCMK